jgi:transcriptional regulator with XRE-family HTH domain
VGKPIKPKPINWVAVRAEYEAGGVTLRQLADRLGVSTRTLERRSSKESWREGVARVSAQCREEVANKVIAQKVQKTLDDLDIINEVIGITHNYIIENPDNFKTTGEAIAALDRMQKIKFEYSKERIQKWLLDNDYIAIPRSEIQASTEMGISPSTIYSKN